MEHLLQCVYSIDQRQPCKQYTRGRKQETKKKKKNRVGAPLTHRLDFRLLKIKFDE